MQLMFAVARKLGMTELVELRDETMLVFTISSAEHTARKSQAL